MKMFIGRVPHGTTVEDLNRHFSQYGQLTDTYIPTPFRNYAFITFASSEDAKNCMVDTHMLNVSVVGRGKGIFFPVFKGGECFCGTFELFYSFQILLQ